MQITAYIRSLFSPLQSAAEREYEPSDPELTGRYFRNAAPRAQGQAISDTTAADLDLDEVFDALDRTVSRVGQQYLYARMRMPESEREVGDFIRKTALFEADPVLTARCSEHLKRLSGDAAYDIQNLIFDSPQGVPHMRAVYLLTAASALSLIGIFFHPLFLLLFLVIFAANAVLHYTNKIRITLYLSAVAQLRKCIRTARPLAAEPALEKAYDTSFLAEMGMVERRCRIIGIQGDGNDFAAVVWLLLELVKIACNAEVILYHRFAATIAGKSDVVDGMFRFVGGVDAAISVARLKGERKTCRPEFIAGKQLDVAAVVHPLIEGCKANSLRLDGQSLLLTGSNMSGKTTFIRTLCINALLGQTLGICFAERFAAPFLRIYTSIRIADDIGAGTSYYLAEVLAIREFLKAAEGDAPCFFAFDELFKGTNTTERIAAAKAVLARLNGKRHLVCAATHDTELAGLLDGGYVLYHFREEVSNGELAFDYQLHEGRLTTRNALRILELYGYPAEVVEDAHRTQERLA